MSVKTISSAHALSDQTQASSQHDQQKPENKNSTFLSIMLLGLKMFNPNFDALDDVLLPNPPIDTVCLLTRSITHLELSYNELSEDGGIAFADALKFCNSLVTINLKWTQLTPRSVRCIARALKRHASLKELDFSGNNVGIEGGKAIADLLKDHPTLEVLKLSQDKKYSPHVWREDNENESATVQIMQRNALRERIKVTLSKKLSDDTAGSFSWALRSSNSIKELDLSWNGFTFESCKDWASALKSNRSLREVNFSGNNLGYGLTKKNEEDGICKIFEALESNTTLTVLDLSENRLTFINMYERIKHSLMKNRTLTTLEFHHNDLTNMREQQFDTFFHARTLEIRNSRKQFPFTNRTVVTLAPKVVKRYFSGTNDQEFLDFACEVETKADQSQIEVRFSRLSSSTAANISKVMMKTAEEIHAHIKSKQLEDNKIVNSLACSRSLEPNSKAEAEENQSTQVPKGFSSAAMPLQIGVATVDIETLEKLKGLPEKHEKLAMQVQTLSKIEPEEFKKLKLKIDRFKNLIESQEKLYDADMEMHKIRANPCLFTYYQFVSRLFTGTWIACQSINTGMVKNNTRHCVDPIVMGLNHLEEGLKLIGQEIPYLGIAAKAFAWIINLWAESEKRIAIQRITRIFAEPDKAFSQISELARTLTLEQEHLIKQLNESPKGIHKWIEKLKEFQAFIEGDDANNFVKWKAIEDCETILNVIKSGTLGDRPSLNELICILLPQYCSGTQRTYSALQHSSSNSRPVIEDCSPEKTLTLKEMAQEIQRMKIREAEQDAERKKRDAEHEFKLRKMDNLISQLLKQRVSDQHEYGDHDVQLKAQVTKLSVNAATPDQPTNASTTAATAYQIQALQLEVTVLKAKIGELENTIDTMKHSIYTLSKSVKNKEIL